MKQRSFLLIFLGLMFLSIGIINAKNDPIVYTTKTGSKYHSAGCSYLRSSSIPMKLSEASKLYSPCSRCNPPTMSSNTNNAIQQDKPSTETVHPSAPVVGTTPTGKTIYEGPRGGHYHYSKSGKKVYERKKH